MHKCGSRWTKMGHTFLTNEDLLVTMSTFFPTRYSYWNMMFKTEMLTHLRALDTLVEALRGLNRKMTAFFLSGPLGFGQSRLWWLFFPFHFFISSYFLLLIIIIALIFYLFYCSSVFFLLKSSICCWSFNYDVLSLLLLVLCF